MRSKYASLVLLGLASSLQALFAAVVVLGLMFHINCLGSSSWIAAIHNKPGVLTCETIALAFGSACAVLCGLELRDRLVPAPCRQEQSIDWPM